MGQDRREVHRSEQPPNTASVIEDIADAVARRERVLGDLVKTLRRFAQIELESADTLRAASAVVEDRLDGARRRKMAAQAEDRARLAEERANRIEAGDRFGAYAGDDDRPRHRS